MPDLWLHGSPAWGAPLRQEHKDWGWKEPIGLVLYTRADWEEDNEKQYRSRHKLAPLYRFKQ